MAGLDPAIHVSLAAPRTWMPGTSPGMTTIFDAAPRAEEASAFSRRLRVDRQRVHAAGEFRGERRIYHAVAIDPALPFEGGRHNINAEVRLAARPVAGVALMQM